MEAYLAALGIRLDEEGWKALEKRALENGLLVKGYCIDEMRLRTGGVEFSFPAREEDRTATGPARRFCRGCDVGIYTESAVSFASEEEALAAEDSSRMRRPEPGMTPSPRHLLGQGSMRSRTSAMAVGLPSSLTTRG